MSLIQKNRAHLALLLAAVELVSQKCVELLHGRIIRLAMSMPFLHELGKLLLCALVLGVLGFEGSTVGQGVLHVTAQRVDLGLQPALLLLRVSKRLLRGVTCLQGYLRFLLQATAFGGPEVVVVVEKPQRALRTIST